jgi:hypothetical protein
LSSCLIDYELISSAKDDTDGGHIHLDTTWIHLGTNLGTFSTPSKLTEHGSCSNKKCFTCGKENLSRAYAVKMMKCKSNLAVLVWELGNLPFAEAMSWLGPFEDPLVNVWLPHFITYDFYKLFLVHTSGFHTFQAAFQMFGITEPKICIPKDSQETTNH